MSELQMSRAWAMPNVETFSVPPIEAFVQKYLRDSRISVDPFSRNKRWATYTNDLNPNTVAEYHMDAGEFLAKLANDGVRVDLVIIDPPYSPRQISECYQGVGLSLSQKDTQISALYARVRDAAMHLLTEDAIVLSFGWNSAGMGKRRGFEIVELLLVNHGAAHNDTICIAERRL